MSAKKNNTEVSERGSSMTNENNILLKLTDLLEKENLISVEEKNHVVMLIRQEGNI